MHQSLAEVEDLIRTYLGRALDVPASKIDPRSSLARLGVDSVVRVGLLAECAALSVHGATVEQLDGCNSVRALAIAVTGVGDAVS